ncbi:MAG: hypothetical protein R3C01_07570 [Planctomycetaceae bacterium]
MFTISVQRPPSSLLRRTEQRLTENRKRLVEAILANVLTEVIEFNPVDSARSRAAWVNSLEQLGVPAPPSWQGDNPTAIAEGRRLGELLRTDSLDITERTAENSVDYVRYLEYGNSRQAPHSMVQRALHHRRQHLARHLTLLWD